MVMLLYHAFSSAVILRKMLVSISARSFRKNIPHAPKSTAFSPCVNKFAHSTAAVSVQVINESVLML